MTKITKKQRNYYKEPLAMTITKYFFLVLFSIFFLFPIYTLVINSFMPDEFVQGNRSLWPEFFFFEPFYKILKKQRTLVFNYVFCNTAKDR